MGIKILSTLLILHVSNYYIYFFFFFYNLGTVVSLMRISFIYTGLQSKRSSLFTEIVNSPESPLRVKCYQTDQIYRKTKNKSTTIYSNTVVNFTVFLEDNLQRFLLKKFRQVCFLRQISVAIQKYSRWTALVFLVCEQLYINFLLPFC